MNQEVNKQNLKTNPNVIYIWKQLIERRTVEGVCISIKDGVPYRKREAWPMVERARQATKEVPPLPPPKQGKNKEETHSVPE